MQITDEMVNAGVALIRKACVDPACENWTDEEAVRAFLTAALSVEQDQKPIAHLVWLQGRRAPDDVEDYYEVARSGDKCVDGSDPFPVYAHPPTPVSSPRDEEIERLKGEREAVRIGDAVLSWLVKFDLADVGNEYRAEDVVNILNELAPVSQLQSDRSGSGDAVRVKSGSRDEIANIIDPHSFLPIADDMEEPFPDMIRQSRGVALRKADRIIEAMSAKIDLPDEPKRVYLDSTLPKFGTCAQCATRNNLGKTEDGSMICGSCADGNYLAEWIDYARKLRSALVTSDRTEDGRDELIRELVQALKRVECHVDASDVSFATRMFNIGNEVDGALTLASEAGYNDGGKK